MAGLSDDHWNQRGLVRSTDRDADVAIEFYGGFPSVNRWWSHMRRTIALRKSVGAGLLGVTFCAALIHPGAAGQSAPTRAAVPKAAAAPPHQVDARSLHVDQLFAQFASGHSPGAAVLVAVDGVVVHKKGYGFAKLSTRHRIDEGTNFRLCSVTKPFTALAVMILAEQGKTTPDTPCSPRSSSERLESPTRSS
jgi:Beta-lactamase